MFDEQVSIECSSLSVEESLISWLLLLQVVRPRGPFYNIRKIYRKIIQMLECSWGLDLVIFDRGEAHFWLISSASTYARCCSILLISLYISPIRSLMIGHFEQARDVFAICGFSYNLIQPIKLGNKDFCTLYRSSHLRDDFCVIQNVVPSSFKAASDNSN